MRSVKAKLAVLVATAVVSSVLLVTLTAAWTDANRRFTAKRAELLGIASTIATAVAHPLSINDATNVSRTLSAIGRIPGLTFARVTDINGRPVQQFGFGVVVGREAGAVEPNPKIGPLTVFYLATYPVAVPIVSGGNQIGQLALIADLSSLRGAFIDSLLSALLAGLAAGVAGLLLSSRLQRGISDPVASLTLAMDEVSRTKNFDRQVVKTSNDEIGRLVDSFNGMLSEVRARDEALASHRDHLESEVEARTSELLDAKTAAEAASAAKSEFLATMSHEIRTPMNGMLVMAEMIATGALTPRVQRYADVLLNSGQTLLAIINDILDFSKIESGKLELERIPVDPRRVIDDTLQLFNERAVSKCLELAANVAPDVPLRIAADPVRLTQVLSNLVNNALKFTESGSIVVRAETRQSDGNAQRYLDLHVTDTGIGIPAEKLATIFEAFSQADQSTTRRFGGTGIGLTICRRLVTAMGGTIDVTSKDGEGSTFTVRIPVDVLAENPVRVTPVHGQTIRVAIAAGTSATLDILAQGATHRGLKALAVDVNQLHDLDPLADHALIASAQDIDSHSAAIAAWRRTSQHAIVVALSRFGDMRATNLMSSGLVDFVLEQPLSSSDLDACFDAIVTGKVATQVQNQAAEAGCANSAAGASFAHLRVLAADDNAVNREVLSEALSRLNVTVTCVDDGRAALEAVKTNTYDIVLMDCSMPVMDGFEATRLIREWERNTHRAALPIIALTAYVVGEAANAWREAGMSGYLTKPYTLKSLRECLERSGATGQKPPITAGDCSQVAAEPAIGAIAQRPNIAVQFASRPLLDRTVLESIEEMQAPGDKLVERIVHLYAQHAPKSLANLIALDGTGKLDKIATAAHALRSLSRNMGATRVADLCTGIETEARADTLTCFDAYCSALSDALPQTVAALLEAQTDSISVTRAAEPALRRA